MRAQTRMLVRAGCLNNRRYKELDLRAPNA